MELLETILDQIVCPHTAHDDVGCVETRHGVAMAMPCLAVAAMTAAAAQHGDRRVAVATETEMGLGVAVAVATATHVAVRGVTIGGHAYGLYWNIEGDDVTLAIYGDGKGENFWGGLIPALRSVWPDGQTELGGLI